jgi:hypothetical protein
MSAKSAVMIFRSPSGAAFRSADGCSNGADGTLGRGVSVGSVSAVAHCPQNRARETFSNPHFGHLLLKGAAHSMQNFVP